MQEMAVCHHESATKQLKSLQKERDHRKSILLNNMPVRQINLSTTKNNLHNPEWEQFVQGQDP